jgi:acetolactate synthase-1/2/3 large subunit
VRCCAALLPCSTDAFQECPAVELTRPCTKWSYQIASLEEIPAVINEAFAVAMSGKRGPVHIDLPKDIMTSVVESQYLTLPSVPSTPPLDEAAVAAVAAMLARAQRPIIIAGQGSIDCHEQLRSFAAAANVPVTTTLHGMGIYDERERSSLHMLGMHGAAYANFAVQAADLILAVGSRFDDRTTGVVHTYAPEARRAEAEGRGGIVHFDIEKTQVRQKAAAAAAAALPLFCAGSLEVCVLIIPRPTD